MLVKAVCFSLVLHVKAKHWSKASLTMNDQSCQNKTTSLQLFDFYQSNIKFTIFSKLYFLLACLQEISI